MKKYLIILAIGLIFMSCNNSKKETYAEKNDVTVSEDPHPGKKLMEVNCYICHSPSAGHEDRIGPPMVAIKKHYIDDNTTKEEFIKNIQAWVKNPTEDKARMFGAVKRFGVMPKTPYPEETIQQIADYMFDHDIDQPEWFEAHFNEEKGKHNGQGKGKGMGKGKHKQQASLDLEKETYADKGLRYALGTKKVLGKNLMGTLQKKGTLEALSFCNEKAYPLTDSMAIVYNANIKRVSDKPRNSKNQASKKELIHINNFKKIIKNNQEPKPIVEELENSVNVYYPITTNAMCLQCHGKPEEGITSETMASIEKLYPNDKAIGYTLNQVRGIWNVSFEK